MIPKITLPTKLLKDIKKANEVSAAPVQETPMEQVAGFDANITLQINKLEDLLHKEQVPVQQMKEGFQVLLTMLDKDKEFGALLEDAQIGVIAQCAMKVRDIEVLPKKKPAKKGSVKKKAALPKLEITSPISLDDWE